MVGRYLADLAEVQDIIEFSDILRGNARIFSFTVSDVRVNAIDALALRNGTRAMCIYRNGNELNFAAPDTLLAPGGRSSF